MPEQNEPKIQWKRIGGSSNVAEIGYSEGNLYIKFKPRNTIYVYYKVPRGVYVRLSRSSSKGKFIHRHIRDVYDYDRLTT